MFDIRKAGLVLRRTCTVLRSKPDIMAAPDPVSLANGAVAILMWTSVSELPLEKAAPKNLKLLTSSSRSCKYQRCYQCWSPFRMRSNSLSVGKVLQLLVPDIRSIYAKGRLQIGLPPMEMKV